MAALGWRIHSYAQGLLTADRSVAAAPSFMVTPTPGAANSIGTLGFVGDTHFSVDRGFFDAPISVAITTTTPGAQIRYTLDGSLPTATTGTVYSAAINITTTRTLRAAAFKSGWTPTDVDTQTYIFLGDVIHQTGAGLPPYGPPARRSGARRSRAIRHHRHRARSAARLSDQRPQLSRRPFHAR